MPLALKVYSEWTHFFTRPSFCESFTQMMPLFSLLFFIICLGNSGTPLTLNFVGEFLSLDGTFERLPIMGALAASSMVFLAAQPVYF